MREVSFHCPFAAQGKQRARSGRGHHYTPPKTRAFEAAVELAAFKHAEWHGERPFDGPVEIEVEAIYAIPKSATKKRRERHMGRPHCQKPDGDNVLKSIADSLNGVIYRDDRQAFRMSISKTWGERDGFRVTVREIP